MTGTSTPPMPGRLERRALDWRIQAARRRLAERDARKLVNDPAGPVEVDKDRARREAHGLIFDEREAEEKPDTTDTSWMI